MGVINKSMFTNLDEITFTEFEEIKKSEKFEIYSQSAVNKFIEDIANTIEKGEEGTPLSEDDQLKVNFAKSEIESLKRLTVVAQDLSKSVHFVRLKKAVFNDIQKGSAAVVGSIHTWNGKKYKKQPNGKWLEVSEQGLTKKDHEYQSNMAKKMSEEPSLHTSKHKDAEKWHKEMASKLSDKEVELS